MKVISLTQGKQAIICDCHYDLVKDFSWFFHGKRYAGRTLHLGKVDGKYRDKTLLMHKVIANTPDYMDTDHINGDKLDNRCMNLRICSHAENMRNRSRPSNSTSGRQGVSKRENGKWRAYITVTGRRMWLGDFEDFSDAKAVREEAEVKYFKDFARSSN